MKFGQSHVKVLARLGARKPANCWERKFSLAAKLSPLPGLLVMAHFYPRSRRGLPSSTGRNSIPPPSWC